MGFLDITNPPNESDLCEEARARGCKVVEPKEVFAEYIAALFKSLTGQELPKEALSAN
jgi:shikimate 5-dehydrogenase